MIQQHCWSSPTSPQHSAVPNLDHDRPSLEPDPPTRCLYREASLSSLFYTLIPRTSIQDRSNSILQNCALLALCREPQESLLFQPSPASRVSTVTSTKLTKLLTFGLKIPIPSTVASISLKKILCSLLVLAPGADVHILLLQIWLGEKQSNFHWNNIMYSVFDRLEWREINLSVWVNNLILLTSAMRFGALVLFATA